MKFVGPTLLLMAIAISAAKGQIPTTTTTTTEYIPGGGGQSPTTTTTTTEYIPGGGGQSPTTTTTTTRAQGVTTTVTASTNASSANASAATAVTKMDDTRTSASGPISTTSTTAPAPCSATNLLCTDSCYCNGRGTANSYSWGSNSYCWCACNGTWYGSRCMECKPGYVAVGAECVKCKKPSPRAQSPVLHGAQVSRAVPFETGVSQCAAALSGIMESSWTWDGVRGSSSSANRALSATVSYTGACATSNIQTSTYFYLVMSGNWLNFWSPQCVPAPTWLSSTTDGAVAMSELAISKATMLVMSAEQCWESWTGDRDCYGFSVTEYLRIAVGVRAALKGALRVTYLASGAAVNVELSAGATATAIGSALATVYEASDNGDNQCGFYEAQIDALLAAALKSSTARTELIVVPDIRGCRTAAVNAKLTSLSKRTNVILIPTSTYYSYGTQVPTIANQDTAYFTFVPGDDAAMEQFLVTRFAPAPTKCSNERPRIVPTAVPLFESSLLMVRDICGVLVKCCFGDVCNAAIRSPPACVVPIGAALTAGERSVTLHVYVEGKEQAVKVSRSVTFFDSPVNLYAYAGSYSWDTYSYAYRGYSAQRSDVRCPVVGVTDVANGHATSAIGAASNSCNYSNFYSYSWGSYYSQGGWDWASGDAARTFLEGWPKCLKPHEVYSGVATKVFPKLLPLPKTDVQTIADSLEAGVTVESEFTRSKPSSIGAPSAASGSRAVGDRSVSEVLATAVQYAIDTALEKSAGQSMQHVRDALLAAGVQSAAAGETRTCDDDSKKAGATQCSWAWSENAAQAGKYLLAAGFEEVETSWLSTADANGNYVQNAQFGDVLVIPSLPSSVSKEKLEKGHVQMMFKGGWVSDVVQDASGFPFQAVKDYVVTKKEGGKIKPALYRLTAGVVAGTEGALLGSAYVWPAASCTGFCDAWPQRATDLSAAITYFNAYYRCPASGADWIPAELGWRWWINGYMCFAMMPASLVNGVGVRCCYDMTTRLYVARYPSMIGYLYEQWNKREGLFVAKADLFAEQQCCMNAADNRTCAPFTRLRPAPLSTNTPFSSPYNWTIGIRWANGFGDPHCMSHDGTEFECNFRGEAIYATCDTWRVHVVATALGGSASSGTIATAVAVKSGSDVLYINATSDKNVSIAMNDVAQTVDVNRPTTLGAFTAFAESADTVEVQDANGNAVQVSAAGSGSALNVAVRVGKGCQKRTAGLLGNADGDATNDLVPRGSTTAVATTLSQRALYTQFVSTWVVTNAEESILPNSLRVRTTVASTATGFTPVFGDEIDMTTCPSACKGVKTCCFDAAQGFPAAASLTGSSKASALNENAVAVGSSAKPPQFSLPTEIKAANGATVTVAASAGSSTIATLECSVCGSQVCTTSGVGTASAVVEFSKAANGRVTCTATNKEGMKATAVTELLSPDAMVVVAVSATWVIVGVVIGVVVLAAVGVVVACKLRGGKAETTKELDGAPGASRYPPTTQQQQQA